MDTGSNMFLLVPSITLKIASSAKTAHTFTGLNPTAEPNLEIQGGVLVDQVSPLAAEAIDFDANGDGSTLSLNPSEPPNK